MALAIQIVLAAAYALFAHAASATGDARYALAALLALVLMLLVAALAARRAWAWIALPVLVGGCWLLYRAGLAGLPLLLVPVAFVVVIAWLFARSLRSPHGPLITRILAGLEGVPWREVPAELRTYTRRLTAAWAGVLGAMGACNLALALVASPGGLLESLGVAPPFTITRTQWSWFANLLNYGVVGGFFIGEYVLRNRWFPARYRSFFDFLRQMAALGPAFWKDFLR
ncbi:MAG TPA: ketosynthase [Luteimonas sp.]|nr:ketosynthase [Luteimonas sp.]